MTVENNTPSLQPGKYYHSKTGNIYQVTGTAIHTETNEPMVVYRPYDVRESSATLYVRPYAMFSDNVIIDGKSVARFVHLPD